MTVKRVSLPPGSILSKGNKKYNHSDSYQIALSDVDNKITSTQLGKAFFYSAPKWADFLFVLRNRLVSLLGLKTSVKPQNHQELLANFNCEPGEALGLFKVFSKTENEVILGEDDRHLNFRISLFQEPNPQQADEKQITISTIVEFNNWFGRLYFLPVRPVHMLIVPAMLKGMARHLKTGRPDRT